MTAADAVIEKLVHGLHSDRKLLDQQILVVVTTLLAASKPARDAAAAYLVMSAPDVLRRALNSSSAEVPQIQGLAVPPYPSSNDRCRGALVPIDGGKRRSL